jgi:hypothetical protein
MLAAPAIRRAEERGWNAGRSLRELLAQGERPDRTTLVDWGCQILEILNEAHARGLLHRHITEDQVIVTPESRVVLNGFGLKRLLCDPRVSPPPERLAGGAYTVRSDLYAVGALLRRLAFAGALHGGRGGLRSRDPLLKVLARATFTDPACRYENAAEMADALREAGRAEVVSRFQRAAGAPAATARVTPFPGAALRLVPASSGASRLREGASSDLWKLVLLATVLLLLVTFVLTTGWLLLGRIERKSPDGFLLRAPCCTDLQGISKKSELSSPPKQDCKHQDCKGGLSLRVTAPPPLGFTTLGGV